MLIDSNLDLNDNEDGSDNDFESQLNHADKSELLVESENRGPGSRKRGDHSLSFATRSRSVMPLTMSIVDNIDTLRRGLLRELALRRIAKARFEDIRSSEEFKSKVGRRR